MLLLIFPAAFLCSGQGGTVSPYSRYGLGDLQFGGFVSQIGMGGVCASVRNPYHLNYSNPASYSALRFATFETGLKGQLVNFSTNQVNGSSNSASFSYLALGFPVIKNKWGASLGLIPYSDIGYEIRDQKTIDQVGRVDYIFEGSGGVNRFYIGSGITVFKNLSVGINASYLFGTMNRTRKIQFPDQVNYFNTLNTVNTNLHDFYFNYGLQYVISLKKEQQITVGLAGAFSSRVRTTNDLLTLNYVITSFGTYSYKDTVEDVSDYKGKTTLPMTWNGGLLYKKGERWLAGIDYSFQNWSKFKTFGINDSLSDSYRLAAGAQLTPDYSSLKILKRIQYKAGFRFSKTYVMLKNTPLNDYAVSVGFGIPLKIKSPPRIVPVISFAVEAGQRGTTRNNLLMERYLNFHLGITISEEWFIPRKFD